MDWIQQWQSKLNKQNGVAPLVRTGGSRHTGLAALPYRNIQNLKRSPGMAVQNRPEYSLVCDFLYFLFFCSFVCHNKPPYFHFLHDKRQPALDCLLHNICYLLLVTKLLSNSILLIAIYSCLLSIIDNYHEYICL